MTRKILPPLLAFLLLATTAHAALTRYWSGSDVDVKPRLHGPMLILAGGGGDQGAAMQAAIDAVRGCSGCDLKLDVVVLRASGGDGYNPWFMALDGVNSVTSMVITDRETSSRPDVVKLVRDAEIVFFAGGDQCQYVRWIKGTPVAEAVKAVYRRGGAIGGTSAGLAIQGEVAYDACPDQSAQSKNVLLDPFSVDVSLSRGFFTWQPMRDVITDTHFQQRDRLGRLLVFMSRTRQEQRDPVIGLGVSERTWVLVDRSGKGRVYGAGPAHLVVADSRAEVLSPKTPLTHRGFRIWRFESGETLDLHQPPSRAPKVIDVVEGKLSADPY